MGHVVGRAVFSLVVLYGRPRPMVVPRLGLLIRGEVGRLLRLGVRRGAPRTLLNEDGRGATHGGAAVGFVAVAPGHWHQSLVSRP